MKTAIHTKRLYCTAGAILLASSLLFAQDAKKPEVPSAAPKQAQTRLPEKAQTRLPDYFNKLSLTDDQKRKIQSVQAANAAKLDELKAQLKAAQEKQTRELEAVLTPDQSKLLDSIREETKKKQAEVKAQKAKDEEKKAAAEGDKKPDAAKKPDAEKKPAADKKP